MKITKIALAFVLSGTSVTLMAENHTIDTSKSKIEWMGSKVVGGSHEGTLEVKSGTVSYEKNQPKSAVITVDMTSIKNTDLTDAEWNKKLVDHLKSDDFFSIEKFKEAKIEIKEFKAAKNNQFDLKGNLTIKGITKPVTLKATVSGKEKSLNTIVADLEFDRTDFNVRYGSGKFFENLGDKMISDKVKVKVELKLKNEIKLGMK